MRRDAREACAQSVTRAGLVNVRERMKRAGKLARLLILILIQGIQSLGSKYSQAKKSLEILHH